MIGINLYRSLGISTVVAATLSVVNRNISSVICRILNIVPVVPTREDLVQNAITQVPSVNFNITALRDAEDFLSEYCRQVNASGASNITLSPQLINTMQIVSLTVFIPVVEEIIFRGGIQEILLTPKSENRDTLIKKIERVYVTSVIFSLYHLINLQTQPREYVLLQIVNTFILGVAIGFIKESNLGVTGAILTHIFYNTLGFAFQYEGI